MDRFAKRLPVDILFKKYFFICNDFTLARSRRSFPRIISLLIVFELQCLAVSLIQLISQSVSLVQDCTVELNYNFLDFILHFFTVMISSLFARTRFYRISDNIWHNFFSLQIILPSSVRKALIRAAIFPVSKYFHKSLLTPAVSTDFWRFYFTLKVFLELLQLIFSLRLLIAWPIKFLFLFIFRKMINSKKNQIFRCNFPRQNFPPRLVQIFSPNFLTTFLELFLLFDSLSCSKNVCYTFRMKFSTVHRSRR